MPKSAEPSQSKFTALLLLSAFGYQNDFLIGAAKDSEFLFRDRMLHPANTSLFEASATLSREEKLKLMYYLGYLAAKAEKVGE